jgi:MoaA/NifB/PqqE/SkfB family radical SAM enzyme
MNISDKVISANILLTRRCNLNCSYCRLTRNYSGNPYSANLPGEVSGKMWISLIDKLNPVFSNIYGGEPLLYRDLCEVISYMNHSGKKYTVFSNGILLNKYLSGCTIDEIPSGLTLPYDGKVDDKGRVVKSGLTTKFFDDKKHIEYNIDDPVVVVTFDNSNCSELRSIVEHFEALGVYTEVTVRDAPKNPWYDFADAEKLGSTPQMNAMFDTAIQMKREGHKILNTVDALNLLKQHYTGTYSCDSPWRILTIEPDLSPRLCLRIRGKLTPKCDATDMDSTVEAMYQDKRELCEKCSWNCPQGVDLSLKSGTVFDDIIEHGRNN